MGYPQFDFRRISIGEARLAKAEAQASKDEDASKRLHAGWREAARQTIFDEKHYPEPSK